MSSPYRSRILSSLIRQSLRLKDRVEQTVRQIGVGLVWGTQVLLYPIYLALQAVRMAHRQLTGPRTAPATIEATATSPPPSEVCDSAILQVLHLVTTLVPITPDVPALLPRLSSNEVPPDGGSGAALTLSAAPAWDLTHLDHGLETDACAFSLVNDQANLDRDAWADRQVAPMVQAGQDETVSRSRFVVRAIASQLVSRRLVLVDPQNNIWDVLTAQQEAQLQQKIAQALLECLPAAPLALEHRKRAALVAAGTPSGATTSPLVAGADGATSKARWLIPAPAAPADAPHATELWPLRWFRQWMQWMEHSEIATTIDLFHESRLLAPVVEDGRLLPPDQEAQHWLLDSDLAPLPPRTPMVFDALTLGVRGGASPSTDPPWSQAMGYAGWPGATSPEKEELVSPAPGRLRALAARDVWPVDLPAALLGTTPHQPSSPQPTPPLPDSLNHSEHLGNPEDSPKITPPDARLQRLFSDPTCGRGHPTRTIVAALPSQASGEPEQPVPVQSGTIVPLLSPLSADGPPLSPTWSGRRSNKPGKGSRGQDWSKSNPVPQGRVGSPLAYRTTTCKPDSAVILGASPPQRQSGPASLARVPPVARAGLEHHPDWVEVSSETRGYVKHPLEKVLGWLDRAMLWLEEVTLMVWHTIQQKLR